MSYVLIPSSFYSSDIDFLFREKTIDKTNVYISQSLYYYLNKIKQQINIHVKEWDHYKKITNPYEYIHTHIFNTNISVSKYKPLSRSFFKMIEIINIFYLLCEDSNIKSFHLAEGPGGFIEAFNYFRNNKYNDEYYGITIISNDVNIPSWKKGENYIKNNKKIKIEYGSSKNGDLFDKQNIEYFSKKYYNSMDYITGDGGIDFSKDFNNQEDLSYKLILSQILYAIIIQKKNGVFVLKIFDIFKYKTIELIYLLSIFYNIVYIYKPYTSRIANSEKYVICKKFKGISEDFKNKIINKFQYIMQNADNLHSIFNFSLSNNFLYKIKEINAIYGQQQLENINTTLNFIREINNLKNSIKSNILNIEHELFFLKEIDFLEMLKTYLDNSNIDNINNIYSIEINKIEKIDKIDNIHNIHNIDNIDNINFVKNCVYQDEKINKIFNKINNKLIYIIISNIRKSIFWCIKYNIEINKNLTFINNY